MANMRASRRNPCFLTLLALLLVQGCSSHSLPAAEPGPNEAVQPDATPAQMVTTVGDFTAPETEQGAASSDACPNPYRELKVEETTGEVREWANKILRSSDWAGAVLVSDKVYALVKSSDSPTDSVELADVRIFAEEAEVIYQAIEYGKDADPEFVNDYLLLQFLADGVKHVKLVHTNRSASNPLE